MNFRVIFLAAVLASTSIQASAALIVNDPINTAQAAKQVAAWVEQYKQMRAQIDSMTAQYRALTGTRGMERVLPPMTAALPADWERSMRSLSSLAQEIRQSQAVLNHQQAAHMTLQLQQFLAQAQNLSAANQAMTQTAFNDAAARQSRLQALISTLATTEDPKAAYDLANRIAIEHAALLKDQNQLEAAAGAAAAQERAQRLMISQMRAASAGTEIPKFDMPEL
ncbi:type IV secretion system protein [Massilia sp. DD77]|uniref:type IV secretion system protein n=1 Tax=Massilia sp. DD77 TaxID=3109349 RepID=UPI002FFF0474